MLHEAGFQCRQCNRSGQLEVHHVKPARKHPDLFFEKSNLMVLCKSCHSEVTRAENGPPDPEREKWKALVKELL